MGKYIGFTDNTLMPYRNENSLLMKLYFGDGDFLWDPVAIFSYPAFSVASFLFLMSTKYISKIHWEYIEVKLLEMFGLLVFFCFEAEFLKTTQTSAFIR